MLAITSEKDNIVQRFILPYKSSNKLRYQFHFDDRKIDASKIPFQIHDTIHLRERERVTASGKFEILTNFLFYYN